MVPKTTKGVAKGKRRVAKKGLKVEEEPLRDYELMLIISPEVVEEKCDATVNNISQLITERGGVVTDVEQWGKKRLAYPIENFMEGNYVLTRFKFRPALSRELEAKLHISEEVIRHLLIRLIS